MQKIHITALLAAFALPASAATVFSFQQGDLRQDGALFGSGAAYTGSFSGSMTDQVPSTTVTTQTVARIGNQFRSVTDQGNNANYGSNGQQWASVFSYDLSELATYISSNPGFSVSATSFTLTTPSTSAGNNNGGTNTFRVYQTEPFTTGANWTTTNGTDAWSGTVTANSTGAVGGGSRSTVSLASASAIVAVNTTMNFSSSAEFVGTVNDALARGDKTLYLLIQGNYNNLDTFTNFVKHSGATVEARPELSITLVPEPSTALLGVLGALALLRRRR